MLNYEEEEGLKNLSHAYALEPTNEDVVYEFASANFYYGGRLECINILKTN